MRFNAVFKHRGQIFLVGQASDQKFTSLFSLEIFSGNLSQTTRGQIFKERLLENVFGLSILNGIPLLAAGVLGTSIDAPTDMLYYLAGLSATAAVSYSIIETNDRASKFTHTARVETLSQRQLGKYNWRPLRAEKVDSGKPWSADNTRLIPSRGKAHSLTTWLARAEHQARDKNCRQLLAFE